MSGRIKMGMLWAGEDRRLNRRWTSSARLAPGRSLIAPVSGNLCFDNMIGLQIGSDSNGTAASGIVPPPARGSTCHVMKKARAMGLPSLPWTAYDSDHEVDNPVRTILPP
jgi:hypothetical protein